MLLGQLKAVYTATKHDFCSFEILAVLTMRSIMKVVFIKPPMEASATFVSSVSRQRTVQIVMNEGHSSEKGYSDAWLRAYGLIDTIHFTACT
jgi:hypothetical protein